MALMDLADYINDSTVVEIYAELTGTVIAVYDGKDSIPDRYMDEEVTDIFVSENKLCVEIAIDPDEDYDE